MPAHPRSCILAIGLAALALGACQRHTGDLFAPPPAPAIVAADQNFGEVVNGQYVVAPGDTVAVVSSRTNTPIRTLIDLNKLTPPYALSAGQRLNLAPRGDYIVQRGDTVSGIAARQGVSISALIQLNNLREPYSLQVGQRLVLPTGADAPMAVAAAQPVVPAAGTPQPQPNAPSAAPTPIGAAPAASPQPNTAPQDLGGGVSSSGLPPLQGAPAPVPATTPQPQPQPVPQPAPQTAQVDPAPAPAAKSTEGDPLPALKASSSFIWPVDGRVISKFGQGKDNTRNDGINIAAPNGAPVLAAADGVVAYAGSELKGFGNMVLVRHADGWVTAYAHNSSLLVQKGAKVRQGQTIARVGSSGNVDKPQLHFELRQGTKAVDPMKVLTH
ncbi:MAG TPA: peptidoglycan DD-metalloendopeptidase family protein [Dongiaceae bacterium]|nr:peptidoglycan DD-metalloendopeptidase family protein [Dongiaceae bacterium]